jgi:hypothetical protein
MSSSRSRHDVVSVSRGRFGCLQNQVTTPLVETGWSGPRREREAWARMVWVHLGRSGQGSPRNPSIRRRSESEGYDVSSGSVRWLLGFWWT